MATEAFYRTFVNDLFVNQRLGINGYLHAALGIGGEAGEIVDIVKKHWTYKCADKEFKGLSVDEYDKLIEEMGDLLYYMQAMLLKMGLTFEDIRAHNVNKLQKRFPNGYSNQAALDRADKQVVGGAG
jgi:phosphoribosyl-ATP pyrophosphohydrolase